MFQPEASLASTTATRQTISQYTVMSKPAEKMIRPQSLARKCPIKIEEKDSDVCEKVAEGTSVPKCSANFG